MDEEWTNLHAIKLRGDDLSSTWTFSHSAYPLAWVREHAGKGFPSLSEDERKAVRAALVDCLINSSTPEAAARRVRPTLALSVAEAEGVKAWRAVLESRGYRGERLEKARIKFADRLLRERALTITRTELFQAHSKGMQWLWREAVEVGLLDPSRMEQEWVATNDSRACERCLGLDGTRALAPDGAFETSGKTTPPLHPNCRCGIVLVEVGSPKIPRAQVNIPGDTGTRIGFEGPWVEHGQPSGVPANLPWHIVARNGWWLVLEAKTGESVGVHGKSEDAVAHLRILCTGG